MDSTHDYLNDVNKVRYLFKLNETVHDIVVTVPSPLVLSKELPHVVAHEIALTLLNSLTMELMRRLK
jgi:hypothetical protein